MAHSEQQTILGNELLKFLCLTLVHAEKHLDGWIRFNV